MKLRSLVSSSACANIEESTRTQVVAGQGKLHHSHLRLSLTSNAHFYSLLSICTSTIWKRVKLRYLKGSYAMWLRRAPSRKILKTVRGIWSLHAAVIIVFACSQGCCTRVQKEVFMAQSMRLKPSRSPTPAANNNTPERPARGRALPALGSSLTIAAWAGICS